MQREHIDNLPPYELLNGYRVAFYEPGSQHTKIPTQTTTWLACKVHLDLGFLPVPENAVHSKKGWQIVKTLNEHPALAAFEKVPEEQIRKE